MFENIVMCEKKHARVIFLKKDDELRPSLFHGLTVNDDSKGLSVPSGHFWAGQAAHR